ncbi:uncharacterized protein LOC106169096 [Lingula anatina]|uniref:Uncharacterized protein LOC106169096 n=1 Tax=Lingula anatina TaxID=7574 RepID=A0A1S3J0W4_LINAN|nr:uncharacterized protein LOC106169096 [Lingula anatina]|eukprot:XP_013403903.1 uncharacterized protein LOC106169096 [Lingula anatina]
MPPRKEPRNKRASVLEKKSRTARKRTASGPCVDDANSDCASNIEEHGTNVEYSESASASQGNAEDDSNNELKEGGNTEGKNLRSKATDTDTTNSSCKVENREISSSLALPVVALKPINNVRTRSQSLLSGNEGGSRRRSSRLSQENVTTPKSATINETETPTHIGPITRSQIKKVSRQVNFDKVTITKRTSQRKRKCSENKVTEVSTPKRKNVWCDECGKRREKIKRRRELRRLISDEDKRRSPRIYAKNFKFPFNFLPVECQMKIFSHLSIFDRARAMAVCRDWHQLIKSPSLWGRLDFAQFYICEHKRDKVRCSRTCRIGDRFTKYVRDICNFAKFLNEVKPAIKQLNFNFDIANEDEPWCVVLVRLLTAANCRELTTVHLDWTHTPSRPQFLDKFCCLFNKVRLQVHQHLFRMHPFGHIFGLLTLRAPNLRHLDIPFDWAHWSVSCLARLTQLETLALRKYVIFRMVEQSQLHTVCSSMPHLQDLTLEIFMPIFHSRTVYEISHPRLQRLDIANSQGFFLKKIDLPQLKYFEVSRKHWEGPLVEVNTFPCLYHLLRESCRDLLYINKEKLERSWKAFVDFDLAMMLYEVCPCGQHAVVWDRPPRAAWPLIL